MEKRSSPQPSHWRVCSLWTRLQLDLLTAKSSGDLTLRRHLGGAAFMSEWRGPLSEEDITE